MQGRGFMELTCLAGGASRKKVAGNGQGFSVFPCPLVFRRAYQPPIPNGGGLPVSVQPLGYSRLNGETSPAQRATPEKPEEFGWLPSYATDRLPDHRAMRPQWSYQRPLGDPDRAALLCQRIRLITP